MVVQTQRGMDALAALCMITWMEAQALDTVSWMWVWVAAPAPLVPLLPHASWG
jgi:hypothetical protein